MQGIRQILIVEDDFSHKELIFRTFEDVKDMQLKWTSSLQEAKKAISESMPDLVIADWRLSDGSGIDLVSSEAVEFPVIIMTSYGNEELAVRSMKAGVIDYVVKSTQAFENLPQNARRALREWDNIIARKKVEAALMDSEERYRLAVEGANDVIWDYDPESGKIHFSGRWADIFGASKGQTRCTFEEFIALIKKEDRNMLLSEWEKHISRKTEFFSHEFRIATGQNDYKWVFARGKALYASDGGFHRFAGSFTDISSHKNNLQKIEELAYYDTITGLPNRRKFKIHLEQIFSQKADDFGGILLFIDIDNFKIINDTFGHSYGDKCLISISKILGRLDIPGKFLCRWSGDEFIILADGIYETKDKKKIAEKILECFRTPIVVEENSFYLSASMGIAAYPQDGETVDELLKNADSAMYQSKNKGRNTYTIFDKTLNKSNLKKMEMSNCLRDAIANNEFKLYYQPQIEISSGEICGFEALLRWFSPKLGMVPPMSFIRLAEEIGLIVPIGYWVIKQACIFANSLYKNYTDIHISVNISNVQLMQTDFVEKVMEIIAQTQVPPHVIALEITESMMMESFESSIEKLVKLKEFGLHIELDDFGTGYSSLNCLKRLPINVVKIDKSFVDDVTTARREKEITKVIVDLAHMLGVKVVAEGVETGEQREILSSYNCDMIQGYLISRPIPENEVEKFIDTYGNEYIIQGVR